MNMDDIDFLIIGAAKSATTWLQRSLQLDPAVCMPDAELHYFSREHHRGDDWYFAQFPPLQGGQLVGEKSNSYLDSPEAATRIHAALPRVKLVAQLRDPVERAYSDYCMLYRRGEVGPDIERHLDPREKAGGRFLENGLYYRQLQAYLENYPADRLLVLLYEDMQSSPADHLARVRGFLGLDATTSPLPVNEKVKDRTTPVIAPALRRHLRPFKPIVAPLRRTRFFKTLRGLVARELEYPALSEDLRLRLVDYYAAETELLGKLMERDLSEWLGRAGPGRGERNG